MKLAAKAAADAFDAPIDAIEADIAAGTTAVMRQVSVGLKGDLRDQVRAAGLSQRLANTWRGNVYPGSGKSLDPATLVFSKAPHIMMSMIEAITIRPINGGKFLAIPTDNTPNKRGTGGAPLPMTPVEVEALFNQDLTILRGKNGRWLGFVNVVEARNKRGFRRATPRRLAQGRDIHLRLMFVFVPFVRTRKLIDLQGAADRWAAQVPILLDKAF